MITIGNGKVTIIVPVNNKKILEGLSNANFSKAQALVLEVIEGAKTKLEVKSTNTVEKKKKK